MIERVYVDNFRCLVKCEVRLGHIALLLGPNGSGKSSLFDAVSAVHQFLGGSVAASDVFRADDLTRWDSRAEQRFELDVRLQKGLYRYAVSVVHESNQRRCRIRFESLTFDDKTLYTVSDGMLSPSNGRQPIPWGEGSGFGHLSEANDTADVKAFRAFVSGIMFIRASPGPEDSLRFVVRQDFLRHLELRKELQGAIDGFDGVQNEDPTGTSDRLRVIMKSAGIPNTFGLRWQELSDGQRQLIYLYTVLLGDSTGGRAIFFDEPDNYLSPREIQPWFGTLVDSVGRHVSQAIVISHHPEVIDYLAYDKGIWFTREDGGPTTVGRKQFAEDEALSPSELEARGW